MPFFLEGSAPKTCSRTAKPPSPPPPPNSAATPDWPRTYLSSYSTPSTLTEFSSPELFNCISPFSSQSSVASGQQSQLSSRPASAASISGFNAQNRYYKRFLYPTLPSMGSRNYQNLIAVFSEVKMSVFFYNLHTHWFGSVWLADTTDFRLRL